MLIKFKQYDLPDFSVFCSEKNVDHKIWRPDNVYLVLGRSNNPLTSLYIEKVNKDSHSIIKRPSGGETVLISTNTLVISVKITIGNSVNTHEYFKIINDRIINALSLLGVKYLSTKGISDICIGERKILGSSIYREKENLFYQSVLNVCESSDLITKYIKHPPREPDYRKGRDHSEFVTSLHNEGYVLDFDEISKAIAQQLSKLKISQH